MNYAILTSLWQCLHVVASEGNAESILADLNTCCQPKPKSFDVK